MFQGNFNGLCFGPNPKQGIFKDSLFIHPDLGFSWIVPSDWKTFNKPASVGSYTEKVDAFIVLTIVDTAKSAREIGEKVKEKAGKSEELMVQSAIDTTINHNNAYLLRLKSSDKNNEVLVELLCIEFEGKVFTLVGAFGPPNKLVAHQALCSFRKSQKEELETVVQYELQVVHAKKSETIEQLSERTGNKLKLPLTELINDVDQKNPLGENSLVKIIRSFPYNPR